MVYPTVIPPRRHSQPAVGVGDLLGSSALKGGDGPPPGETPGSASVLARRRREVHGAPPGPERQASSGLISLSSAGSGQSHLRRSGQHRGRRHGAPGVDRLEESVAEQLLGAMDTSRSLLTRRTAPGPLKRNRSASRRAADRHAGSRRGPSPGRQGSFGASRSLAAASRPPAQLGASRSARGGPEPASSRDAVVVRRVDGRLGLVIRPSDLVLMDCAGGDAAAAGRFIGRTVTHVEGVPVYQLGDLLRLSEGKDEVEVAFAPQSSDRPLDPAATELISRVQHALTGLEARRPSVDEDDREDGPALLDESLPMFQWVISVPLGPDEDLGIVYDTSQRGALRCREVFGAAARAGLPLGAAVVRIDGQPVSSHREAAEAVAQWRRKREDAIVLHYVGSGTEQLENTYLTSSMTQRSVQLPGDGAPAAVFSARVLVRPGEDIGVLWEWSDGPSPLWCRRVYGNAMKAGVPDGAVIIRIDGQEVPTGEVAAQTAHEWLSHPQRGMLLDVDYLVLPAYANPPPAVPELQHILGDPPPQPQPVALVTPPHPGEPAAAAAEGPREAARSAGAGSDPERPVFDSGPASVGSGGGCHATPPPPHRPRPRSPQAEVVDAITAVLGAGESGVLRSEVEDIVAQLQPT
eukprot:TRINITY_DN12721_c0_g1_i1.p1 TRINITY_DN12721_c0_g1~~TRINITY_DN12721_c0_g1_i1.p1  ORF type:complete len:668 (+),score=176.09 TRINITY_DN12721_c0_g1_i1:102-2006(+)